MSIRMIHIGFFRRDSYSGNYNKGAEYVGSRMHRIRYHCSGSAEDSRQQFPCRKQQVHCNTDRRHPHSRLLILFVYTLPFFRHILTPPVKNPAPALSYAPSPAQVPILCSHQYSTPSPKCTMPISHTSIHPSGLLQSASGLPQTKDSFRKIIFFSTGNSPPNLLE